MLKVFEICIVTILIYLFIFHIITNFIFATSEKIKMWHFSFYKTLIWNEIKELPVNVIDGIKLGINDSNSRIKFWLKISIINLLIFCVIFITACVLISSNILKTLFPNNKRVQRSGDIALSNYVHIVLAIIGGFSFIFIIAILHMLLFFRARNKEMIKAINLINQIDNFKINDELNRKDTFYQKVTAYTFVEKTGFGREIAFYRIDFKRIETTHTLEETRKIYETILWLWNAMKDDQLFKFKKINNLINRYFLL